MSFDALDALVGEVPFACFAMHPPPPPGSSPSMDWFLLGASVRVGKALASNQPFGSPVVIPRDPVGGSFEVNLDVFREAFASIAP